ncbi:acyl-CoA N-acyltransferase [Myriangium duriaei CBS 260.36]|uniref:Acyl-CoA N-acyltransferase n=1 Tax=Myriangium duriaei CBS 260.36 TaxID=1168546 RepID=A0A9P4MLD7_9PEZI|nr:acyl-CoA N-acyltransferase [Myriangium duriaei CBS 260.36]
MEDSDDAFLAELSANATDFTNASPTLPAPRGSSHIKESLGMMQKGLLGVWICLPASSSSSSSSTTATTESDPSKPAEKPKPTPIGYICLSGSESHNAHHRHTMIGLTVASKYQGKGYGSEAIKWALNWAFVHANIHRVEIGAFEWNTGALRLYERLGFVLESRKRKHFWYQGKYWDVIEFGMLDTEWKDLYGQGK